MSNNMFKLAETLYDCIADFDTDFEYRTPEIISIHENLEKIKAQGMDNIIFILEYLADF